MIKPGDWVYITDEECVSHTGEGTCCDADFSKPVRVKAVYEDELYPLDVEVGKCHTCPFALDEVRKVEEDD